MTRREQKLRYYYANRETILRKKREKRSFEDVRAKERCARRSWRERNRHAEKVAWVFGVKIAEARAMIGTN